MIQNSLIVIFSEITNQVSDLLRCNLITITILWSSAETKKNCIFIYLIIYLFNLNQILRAIIIDYIRWYKIV